MGWMILGLLLGFLIGLEYRQKDPSIDYSKIDEKLRNELSIAQNLNQSLLADKHELQEKLWKLQNDQK